MIKLENVSMKFNLAEDKVSNLKDYMIKLVKGEIKYTEFWALKNISVEVKKGEILGIIGRNGAGKSTLLKIAAGVMKPTSGTAERRGAVAPMLELGAGFEGELTARENVYLNGALLGYTENFINEKYDEIVDFSGLNDFMDTPVRNFSSGMAARLAFSINSLVTPDILIVDEVLAVGDEEFKQKSYNKMIELISGGATVVFVSHGIEQVKQLCKRALWLDKGVMKAIGESERICDLYMESFINEK